jgi:hypothetical protein
MTLDGRPMMGQERRRHPRFVVDVPVRIVDQGTEHTGRLRDICREAALVETARAWPLDAEVGLRMQLPGVNEGIDVAGLRIDFFVALQTDLAGSGGAGSGPPAS